MRRRAPPVGVVQQNQEKERQDADAGKIERDADCLVLLPVEPRTGQRKACQRQPEDGQWPGEARHGVIEAVRAEVEQAAGKQEEGAQVEHDLRIGQRPARHNPVVFTRFETPVGREERRGFVRIDEPEPQPFARPDRRVRGPSWRASRRTATDAR